MSSPLFLAGQKLTAGMLSLLGELDYAEGVAQTGITTETTITAASVTFTAIAGIRYDVEAYLPILAVTNSVGALLRLKESTTVLGRIDRITSVAAGDRWILKGTVPVEPSAGAHTYTMSIQRTAGTGTITTEDNTETPIFLRVKGAGRI